MKGYTIQFRDNTMQTQALKNLNNRGLNVSLKQKLTDEQWKAHLLEIRNAILG